MESNFNSILQSLQGIFSAKYLKIIKWPGCSSLVKLADLQALQITVQLK